MTEFMLKSDVDAMSDEEKDAIFQRVMSGEVEVVDEMPSTTIAAPVRVDSRAATYAKPAESLSLADMSEMSGVPAAMFCQVDGKPFIKSAGLLYMADKKGVRAIECDVTDDGNGGYVAEARVYPNWSSEDIEIIKAANGLPEDIQRDLLSQIGKPFVGYGTANSGNLNGKTSRYAREMAETRAMNRALRKYTAYGFCTVEELREYVPSDDEDFATARRV